MTLCPPLPPPFLPGSDEEEEEEEEEEEAPRRRTTRHAGAAAKRRTPADARRSGRDRARVNYNLDAMEVGGWGRQWYWHVESAQQLLLAAGAAGAVLGLACV